MTAMAVLGLSHLHRLGIAYRGLSHVLQTSMLARVFDVLLLPPVYLCCRVPWTSARQHT
jgi:hypothetical protein